MVYNFDLVILKGRIHFKGSSTIHWAVKRNHQGIFQNKRALPHFVIFSVRGFTLYPIVLVPIFDCTPSVEHDEVMVVFDVNALVLSFVLDVFHRLVSISSVDRSFVTFLVKIKIEKN